jgi:hypothetical protein
MREGKDEGDLQERVGKLEALAIHSVEALGLLVDQNAALMMAVAFLRARLQDNGGLDGEDLADLAIAHMNETMEPSEARSSLLRNLLAGEPPKPVAMPRLTVIQGGRDTSPPDHSDQG